jgi:hypothetical protein
MTTRNALLVTALAGAFTFVGASLFLAQMASQASAQSSAQPASGASHSQAATASKPGARKAATAAAVHARQPLAELTRIEILPSSITIMGPRYNQRLLVEGTFADGHQEELTPRATVAVSNPKVAIVDIDDFSYGPGPSRHGDGERQRLCGRNHLEFSQ